MLSKKIAVVGGTGFIGYHIVNELIGRKYAVTVIARKVTRTYPKWHDQVTLNPFDVHKASVEQFETVLAGHQGFVYAGKASADDQESRAENIDTICRMIMAGLNVGCDRAVILGSYFTYFTPDKFPFGSDLQTKHLSVQGSLELYKVARETAGTDIAVTILEIPWVFGATPGRGSLWKSLIDWTHSRFPIFVPSGGTAAVSVETVAKVTTAAIATRSNKTIPVAEGNFTWTELLNKLTSTARPIHHLPHSMMSAAGLGISVFLKIARKKERGLNPRNFLSKIFTKNLFIDLNECRGLEKELGLSGSQQEATQKMEASFSSTLRICTALPLKENQTPSINKEVSSNNRSQSSQLVWRKEQKEPAFFKTQDLIKTRKDGCAVNSALPKLDLAP